MTLQLEIENTQLRLENARLRAALEAEKEKVEKMGGVLDSLIAACDASHHYPKPGPCGQTIDACMRHEWIKLSGHYVEDARAAAAAIREGERDVLK